MNEIQITGVNIDYLEKPPRRVRFIGKLQLDMIRHTIPVLYVSVIWRNIP